MTDTATARKRGRPLGSKNKIFSPRKTSKNAMKPHSGMFKKGWKGGPGRPEGSRNKVSLLIDEMGAADVMRAYQHLMALSVGEKDKGDLLGCKYIVERFCPPRRGFMIDPSLSEDIRQVKTQSDINAASQKVTQMVLEGLLSVEEADGLCRVLDHRLKVLTDTDVLRKIEETCTKVDSLYTQK